MPHTCSRKGYARLEDELRRKKGKSGKPITRGTVWVAAHKRKNGEPINKFAKEKIDMLNEIDCDIECGRGDALSQVLDPYPNGRVHGVGYGVTSSTLYGVQQCYGRMSELQEKYDTILEEMSSIKELVAKLMNSEEPSHSSVQPSPEVAMSLQSSSFQSNHNLNSGRTKSKDVSTGRSLEGRRDHQSPFVPSNHNSVTKSKVVKCKLFRLVPEDVVTKGFWYTDDPAAIVHTKPLGPGYLKVSVKVAIQKDALLVRGNNALKTIEDAFSSFVAWPTNSIIKL